MVQINKIHALAIAGGILAGMLLTLMFVDDIGLSTTNIEVRIGDNEDFVDDDGSTDVESMMFDGASGETVQLDPVTNETRPARLDWLHIPKAGTSFLYSMILYKCDDGLKKRAALMRKKYPNDPKKAENAAIDAERDFMRVLSLKVRSGKARDSCTRGLRYHHKSLLNDPTKGHSHIYEASEVVTMVRPGNERIASGLIHDFHDCSSLSKKGPQPREVCSVLMHPNITKEHESHKAVVARIIEYAQCVKGCGVRMVTGSGGCGHPGNGAGKRENLVPPAIEKLKKFAFVGLTDRWAESMCVWKERFPRPSGRDYLEDINANVRPSTAPQCGTFIQDVLLEHEWEDDYDQELYEAGRRIFEKSLERHPHCKQQPQTEEKDQQEQDEYEGQQD